MYTGLLHFHSFWRYIVLLLLVIAVVKSISGWLGKRTFASSDNKISLFTTISIHIQLLMGLSLYFISPYVKFSDFGSVMKNTHDRFWTVEHTILRLVAVVLITIGRLSSKKAATDIARHKKIAIYFTIGLLLILLAIPWPFSNISRPWF